VVAEFRKLIDTMTGLGICKEIKSDWRNESIHCLYTVPFAEPSELSAKTCVFVLPLRLQA